MMPSIERRLRRSLMGVVLLILALAIGSVLVANERLEQSLLALNLQTERDFLMGLVNPETPLRWNTATLQAYYEPLAPPPDGSPPEAALPAIFRDLPFPYAGELHEGSRTYAITNAEVQGGRLYLAKDISNFKYQEQLFHRFLALLAVTGLILSILLSRLTSRRLAVPLTSLTRAIAHTTPSRSMARVPEDARDQESLAIARSFNRFLDALESYVRREKTLLGMASHELRTPIAIIAGALDVIEQRGEVSPADARALRRIRRGIDDMNASVQAILQLTRQGAQAHQPTALAAVVGQAVGELRRAPELTRRVWLHLAAEPVVPTVPALVAALVRNLAQNALQHTTGNVHVRLTADWLEVSDDGQGLPESCKAFLRGDMEPQGEASLPGLGLFLVTLICEQLRWRLELIDDPAGGTRLRLHFPA